MWRRDVTATKKDTHTLWDIIWSEMGGHSNTHYMWTNPVDKQAKEANGRKTNTA